MNPFSSSRRKSLRRTRKVHMQGRLWHVFRQLGTSSAGSTCASALSRVGDLHHQFEEQGKHSINQCMLFDENYGLASTQSLKNKDISEGGAEGDYFAFIGAVVLVLSENSARAPGFVSKSMLIQV
ncbi:hypothetical protein B0H19DRAFT_1232420 [Mycena capillaripes]|nr:hypothetical protein B0H19DRAFT_1242212 [Mycena capillaripes]KAJ6569692.1 hypothetical protein B0H19DRAFT_1232420 [Mycena capillaripes]